jgi:hypothetical protein
VNCAADDTAPFRLARTLRNWLKQKLAVSFLLANAHVASCGWLGIHEAHLQAFGFGVNGFKSMATRARFTTAKMILVK